MITEMIVSFFVWAFAGAIASLLPFFIARYRGLPEYCEKYGYFPALTEEDIDGFLGDNFAKLMGFAK